jgi:hypothetical protein
MILRIGHGAVAVWLPLIQPARDFRQKEERVGKRRKEEERVELDHLRSRVLLPHRLHGVVVIRCEAAQVVSLQERGGKRRKEEERGQW